VFEKSGVGERGLCIWWVGDAVEIAFLIVVVQTRTHSHDEYALIASEHV
jgi:hypothetical protein